MAPLPAPRHPTRDAIYAAYEARQGDGRRDHLGASMIGRECDRQLWFSFRWVDNVRHDGRLLRLFDTGNHEEPRMVADLRAIGATVMEVNPDDGRQWQVRDPENAHFGGSMDGVAMGVPEAPKKWHVLEFKTSNAKGFRLMVDKGVQVSKPEHYAQMQVYMHLTGIDRALYIMKNKDTDELHVERVRYDVTVALQLIEKARRIVNAQQPPAGISADPSFWKCKFCDFRDVCHGGQQPERNCRTCMSSTPVADGSWNCAKHDETIPSAAQRQAHPCHRFIPDLVPRRQTDVQGENIHYEGWIDEGR